VNHKKALSYFIASCAAVTVVASAVAADAADDYPSKPIELVVPYAPGGTNDVLGRMVGEALATEFGKPVVILNKPGGSAAVGTFFVARAKPDGHTLVVGSQGTMSANPYLMDNLPYDPLADFAPVALIGSVNNVLVVPKNFPANSLKEFTSYASKHPGKINFAHAGIGTSMSLAGELYKIKTGTDLVSIGYKGSAPATLAVVSGEVQAMFANTISVIEQVKAGSLKPLAATGSARDQLLPNVPTFQEEGVDGYSMESWFGIFAPAATPKEIVQKLNTAIRKALTQPKNRDMLASLGVTPGTFSPEEYASFVKSDNQAIGQLIKESGLKEVN